MSENNNLKEIFQKISNAIVIETSNWDTNKKLWDNYASEWVRHFIIPQLNLYNFKAINRKRTLIG